MDPNEIVAHLKKVTKSAQSQYQAQNYDRALHLIKEIKLDTAHLIALHEKELSRADRLSVEDCVFTAYKLRYRCFKSLAQEVKLPLVGRFYHVRAAMTLEAAHRRFQKEIADKDRRKPAGWAELERLIRLRR